MKSLLTLEGVVKKGQERGKRLGFPTINFSIMATLPEGIYISQATIHGKIYNSLTFIGAAITYNESVFQAETYLLEFAEDVYGERVIVSLLKKIRDNQKFSSEKELVKQMEEDKRQAEEFFLKH